MLKNGSKICVLAMALLLLSGCFFRSSDDLYAVPKAPEDYQNLQAKIDEVRGTGAEYAAPLTGSYTQTVQLRDLDGDGVQEAIAFFRMRDTATNTGKPLKIYIYRQQPDGSFDIQAMIEGDGTAINSIAYEDLGGDEGKEIVVSWQMSKNVYQLMAYAIHDKQVEQILYAPYTDFDFTIWDLDKDNQKEIVVLNVNPVDAVYQAELYDYDTDRGAMVLRDSAPMSREIVSLAEGKPRVGYLRDYEPALFVTAHITTGIVTDIFAWRNARLTNITLDAVSGISESTYRFNNNVGIRDINADLILALPRPVAFPDPKKVGGADNFWSIQWVQYDLKGTEWPLFTTYYNGEDGWYLILPEAWKSKINPDGVGPKITLSRRDVVGSGERAVVFSLWDGNENTEPVPFLKIYKLTGPNQVSRSQLEGRFVLADEADAIYAAEFTAGGWDCGLTQEGIKEQFRFIRPEWPTGQ